MSLTYNPRSIPQIFTDLVNRLTDLLRKEAELARTEASEKISQAATALGLIVIGAVLLIPALVVLLEAGVATLDKAGFAPYWSAQGRAADSAKNHRAIAARCIRSQATDEERR